MSVFVRDLAKVLREAGVNVKEMKYKRGPHTGRTWKTVGYKGMGYSELPLGIVWHHDASPASTAANPDSYGALEWMMYDGFGYAPAANAWVDRYGTWHLYAAGYSNHAGQGAWPPLGLYDNGNAHLFGVETDHTDGEAWPEAQVSALRAGTAAILKHWGRPADNVIGHYEWAPGRKSDPAGLNMKAERKRVARLMGTQPSGWLALLRKWVGLKP